MKLKYNLLIGSSILSLIILHHYTSISLDTKSQKIRETTKLLHNALNISAGPDKIWSIAEQRRFLNEMPLKSDRVLIEGGGIFFVPNEDNVNIYLNINIYLNTINRTELYGDRHIISDNHLGNLDRRTLESYISRNTAQLEN